MTQDNELVELSEAASAATGGQVGARTMINCIKPTKTIRSELFLEIHYICTEVQSVPAYVCVSASAVLFWFSSSNPKQCNAGFGKITIK